MKNNICINVFSQQNGIVFLIYICNKRFKDSIDLLLLIDDDKSHYVYLKDFIFRKMRNNNKKQFCKNSLQCFTSENILIKHRQDCLSINSVKSVGGEQGKIDFQNYFKQIAVPIKIYAYFGCNLENTEVYEDSYTKKYHDHAPYSFVYKVICIDDKFSKPIVVYRGENAA